MVLTKNRSGRAYSIPGGLVAGGAVSMILTLILSAVTAKMALSGILEQSKIGYASMIILLFSAAAGAGVAQGKVKHRRMMVCVLSGLVYMILLLGITALFFGGQYTGVWATALVVFAGTGVAALLSGRGGNKRRKGMTKTRIRH